MPRSNPNSGGRIFISYRRDDTAYPTGWLFDRLADRFGSSQVFKDVDSIDPGDDFLEELISAVASCDVLLAMIGDRWLAATDETGARRIDSKGDYVALELEAAMTRGVRVVPILVDGAGMPPAAELPKRLKWLANRQAVELGATRFDSDLSRLLNLLESTISEVRDKPRTSSVSTDSNHLSDGLLDVAAKDQTSGRGRSLGSARWLTDRPDW